MPIDTSIYSTLRPVEVPSYMDSAGKAATMSQLAMQNRQMAQAASDQDAVRSAFSKNVGPDGQINRQGVLSDLARNAPMQAMDYQGKFSQADAARADQEKKVLQDKLDKYSTAYRMASSATDQPSYDQMKQQMQSMGLPVDHLPPQFDPAHIGDLKAKAAMMTMDAKQGLDAISKTSEMAINEKKAPLERNKLGAETRHLDAETGKLQAETPKRPADVLGQNDPAKLVPSLVPKEHQAKAFAEIDAAENTRKMAKSILQSFDDAAKDTSGLVDAPWSMLKQPRSVGALHQSMQPTFKDLEGTVRQAAMDNTFKNVTPNAGDTARDLQIKRAALEDYLQSKLSAPTARAYGIDLTKFDSTAPYKSPATAPAQKSGGMIKSAYAAEPPRPGTVEDGHIFMGGDPADKNSWKRTK